MTATRDSADGSSAPDTLIEGSLRDVPLADVLQLLARGRRDVEVRVAHGTSAARGVVLLRRGRVVGAELRTPSWTERDVTAVAMELLRWTSGRVHAQPATCAETDDGAVTMTVDALLLDAAHAADEWARLGDRVTDASATPTLRATAAHAAIAWSPLEWQVVAYADGARDLRGIAGCAGVHVLDVARAVYRLIGDGVLVLVGPASPDEIPGPNGATVPCGGAASSAS